MDDRNGLPNGSTNRSPNGSDEGGAGLSVVVQDGLEAGPASSVPAKTSIGPRSDDEGQVSTEEAAPGPRRAPGGKPPEPEVDALDGPVADAVDAHAPEAPPPKRSGQAITADVYNVMWRAWCRQQSLSFVAAQAGVTLNCARRYVLGKGDPDKGMVPIRLRWLRVQARVQAEEEMTLVRYRREQMELVGNSLKLLTAELMLYQKDVEQRLTAARQQGGQAVVRGSLDKLTSAVDRMVRLGDRLLGGPDEKVEYAGSGVPNRFATWTPEELMEYAKTGVAPEHDRALRREQGGIDQ